MELGIRPERYKTQAMPAAIRETSYEMSETHEASANNELSDSHGRVMK